MKSQWEQISEVTGIDIQSFLAEAIPAIIEWAKLDCPKGGCGTCHVCLSKSVAEKLANPIIIKPP